MTNFKSNANVKTPNGPGVVVGSIVDDGVPLILVRHQFNHMSGNGAGKCITPRAQVSGLWEYPHDEVEPA